MNHSIGILRDYRFNASQFESSKKYKCQNCQLQFQSSYQLLNHTKKFCTNSGFDTLPGLNIKLKHPNHNQNTKINKRKFNDSLTNALQQIQKNQPYLPNQKQIKHDILDYQRHKQHITYVRPYVHQSKKNIEPYPSGRKSRSLYINSNNQNNKYGQKLNDSVSINYPKSKNNYQQVPKNIYDPLNINYEPSKSKAYSLTSSYMRKFKQQNGYISPPTQIPQLQNGKNYNILQKSDTSIKNMSIQQKRQYVIRKLLQLQQIQQAYKKNGGKNNQFKQNTEKMKMFYNNLLEDINNNRSDKFGKISNGTRVSTPISKLDQLKQSNISYQNDFYQQNKKKDNIFRKDKDERVIKSKISQIHNKNMANRQDQIRKRFKTQFPQKSNIQQRYNNDILDEQIYKKIKNKDNSNQIIVIPIQQPSQQQIPIQHNQLKQTQLTLKYLQKVNQLKQQQNRNFIQILQKQNHQMKKIYEQNIKNKQKEFNQNKGKIKTLQNKYNKLLQTIEKQKEKQLKQKINFLNNNINNNQFYRQNDITNKQFRQNKNQFRIQNKKHHRTEYSLPYQSQQIDKQYRQMYPQLNNIRLLNIQQPGFNIIQNQNLTKQQKILMQMQQQQRDQLQLFSHLPPQIQKLKQQSLKQLSNKRFEMEKQVIKQKLQKLNVIENVKNFQLQRKLLTQELQNQKKKIQIHKLMKKKVKNLVKQQFQASNSDSSSSTDKQDQFNQDFLVPNKPISRSSKTNSLAPNKQ